MPDTQLRIAPFPKNSAPAGKTLLTPQRGGRKPASKRSKYSAACSAISIENRGNAVIFIKSQDMCLTFDTPTQPPWAASLGYRKQVSPELVFVYRGLLKSPILSFSAPQDRTRSIRKRTPGCLSAVWARNRQLCGTRWFLLNAARFPA